MSDRSADNHPPDRWSDRVDGWKKIPAWFWHHKLYRDIWLVAVTVAVVLGFQAIQDSRYDTLVRSCTETNQRHDQTVDKLDELISKIKDPVARRAAEKSKPNTVFLIDKLAPYEPDCKGRAERLLAGGE